MDDWWNPEFKFRRVLTLTSLHEDVETGHYVLAPVSAQNLHDRGKARVDFEDVEVVHMTHDATPVHTVMERDVTEDGIVFYLNAPIAKGETQEGTYFIYYGNRALVDSPGRPDFTEEFWSVEKGANDSAFSYTRPGEHWKDGVSHVTNAVATIKTFGPFLRVKSLVGIDRGVMDVSVDSGEWEEVDQYSVTSTDEYVYEKTDLSIGKHRVQMRVSGTANPSSIDKKISIVNVQYQTPVKVTDVREEIYHFDWSSVMTGA